MLTTFIKDKILSKKRALIQRNFEPQIITSNTHHEAFKKNGYTVIKNVLDKSRVDAMLPLFHEIKQWKEYEITDAYNNSMSFSQSKIRTYVCENLFESLVPDLPNFLNTDAATFPFGASYCINPPSSIRGCLLHQDPTMIDEASSYSMTIWIALTDMTVENGCLHLIPGSHLWGNIYRSVSMEWPFTRHLDALQPYKIPIEVKAGDAICFDVSTIHGSTCNFTDEHRLATNIVAIPKKLQMINYFPESSSKLGLYEIDANYFKVENQLEKPSSKYPLKDVIATKNNYSLKNIQQLVAEFNTLSK